MAAGRVHEQPVSGPDSNRGDFLPMVDEPEGLAEALAAGENPYDES